MGDDPYNFEIALPTTLSHATRSTRKRHEDDSDEDISDASDSLSSMSGVSSDSSSDRENDHKLQQRTESNYKRLAKSINESKTAASSGGSALDRAKNFLSKYSNVATGDRNEAKTSNSSRSRRVSLDLDDDDDISIESSNYDEEDTNKGATTNKQGSGFPEETRLNPIGILRRENGEDESDQSSEHPPVHSETPCASTVHLVMPARRECNSDESEVGDSIESIHSEASVGRLENITALDLPQRTQLKPAYGEDSADDYNESFQEESLSQSNVDNLHRDIQPSRVTPTFTLAKPQQKIASDSGVYEEEGFEQDDSAVVAPTPASVVTAPQSILTTDKSFDYSMDFSDNEVEVVQPQFSVPQSIIDDPVGRDAGSPHSSDMSIQSDHDKDDEEQSEFLESGSFQDERREHITKDTYLAIVSPPEAVEHNPSGSNEVPVDRSTPTSGSSGSHEQSFSRHGDSSYPFHQDDKMPTPIKKTTDMPTAPTASAQKILPLKAHSADEEIPTTKQRHVVIVRAFHSDEEVRVEMKDASTQFTGNHAAIQADLIPDGMHNALLSASSESPTTTLPSGKKNEMRSSDENPSPCHSEQQPPPAPPIPSFFGSPLSNLEAFKLPMMTSTSIYKQQLLALQEQILQKKRETERIVHDRMSFQYSSLRGAERFVSARRARKLELWEALMRVDPTLDERKAREVACLAQAASM
ncbi:Hypothetical protein PHPALM_14934 [Phytophthora palmivora]|uniref:Uncharacterized protein n=1 Tax=Phytophthora palmivora TaxID=4796 RepID=A0A2P4XTE4_9STRA|nr:Hypothetical protein PHPALM_14934 [Phytophthora palmivora]